ncbi:DoxX family membrane protein [Aquimarina longa]|uniref:DoxX family membrane protein n=1 Tax=Aquimarina longa TaxID=1080221 RepID=UPI00078401CC|nr:DoxX family membrane protein [Aquimarina longa]
MTNKDFTTLLIRLFLGFTFFSSGLCKLSGGSFGQFIGPPDLITTLSEYDLEGFGYLIVISQVIFGVLVLTQRFSLLGLIGLIPMNLGIISVTISQQWPGTPYVNTFILLLNILVLVYEYDTLKGLVLVKSNSIKTSMVARLFPNIILPIVILMLTVLSISLLNEEGFYINFIGSITMVLVGVNIYQRKTLSIMERSTLFVCLLGLLIVINLQFIYLIFASSDIILGVTILLSFLLYMITSIEKAIQAYQNQR